MDTTTTSQNIERQGTDWTDLLAALGGAALGCGFWLLAPHLQSLWGATMSRVLRDYETCFSLMAFGIAMALLVRRGREVRRQVAATAMLDKYLGDDPDTQIHRSDAQSLWLNVRERPSAAQGAIVLRLLETGLQRARGNWSAEDAGAAIMTESNLIGGQIEANYSLIGYCASAIPSLGFIGTVRGIGTAIGRFRGDDAASQIRQAAGDLFTAFDTTLVALVLGLILTYAIHRVQSRDDLMLVNSVEACMQRLVYRMSIPRAS